MTEQQLKMYRWITEIMLPDKWYPIKSIEAYKTIIELFDMDLLITLDINCDVEEFDCQQHIRKRVMPDFYKKGN